MALILNMTLRLLENEAFVRSGGWARREKPPALGHDIQGKTLGVIGFGRIGQEVTRRMQALGMKTLWYDVFATAHPDAPKSERRALDQLLAESDYITLHTNLDDGSRHLIGAAELAKMKPTAYLINTARGRWSTKKRSPKRSKTTSSLALRWTCSKPNHLPQMTRSTRCPM